MKILIGILYFLSLNIGAQTIVSTSPALSEIVTELGFEASIVGRTPYCLDAVKANVIGTSLKLDYEKIINLKADIIFLQENSPTKTSTELKKLNLEFKSYKLVSLEDIEASVKKIASYLKVDDKKILSQLQLSGQSIFDNGLIMLGGVPGQSIMVAGSDTYYSKIASKLKMVNLIKVNGWPKLTAEKVRSLINDRSVVIEIATQQKNLWTKEQWSIFCPQCKVKSFVSPRSAYPGVSIVSELTQLLTTGAADD